MVRRTALELKEKKKARSHVVLKYGRKHSPQRIPYDSGKTSVIAHWTAG